MAYAWALNRYNSHILLFYSLQELRQLNVELYGTYMTLVSKPSQTSLQCEKGRLLIR